MGKRDYPPWMGKMRGLTEEEISQFLSGPVVARLATVRPDGRPYVNPVWQHWDGRFLYLIAREKSAFVGNLRHDPAVAVSVALDQAPFTRVLIQGRAEVEPPRLLEGELLEIARKMAVRYLGERGAEYLEPTADRPRCLIRVIPEEVTSWEGVEWHPKYLPQGEQEA